VRLVCAVLCGLAFLATSRAWAQTQDGDEPVIEIDPDAIEPKPVPYGPEEPPPEAEPPPDPEPTPPPEEPEEEEGGPGPLSGRIFSYARAQVDGDLQQVSASAWLELKPRFTESSSAKLSLAVDLIETSLTGQRGFRGRLREAYVTYKKRGWLLRLGQQIIPWGSADVFNPTDLLGARDPTILSADTEDSREGAVSLFASKVLPGPGLEFTLVATPIHATSRLLIPPGAIPEGVTLGPPAPRTFRLQNGEVAGKIKLSGSGWDLAILGFRGWQHTPELVLVSVDTVGTEHHRLWGGGLDGSASLGRFTFRLEAAYLVTKNPNGTDPTIQPSHAAGVLGVERPFFERFRVQLQVFAKYHPRWQSPEDMPVADPLDEARKQVAIANALLLDYVDQFRGTTTLRVAYTSESDKLEIEVFAAMNFFYADFVVRPRIGYRFTDAFLLEAGYEAYGGDRKRPLGALRPFSGGFLQATFTY
jgi:hypothetical protein